MLTYLHAHAHHSGHTYVHLQLCSYIYNIHGTFSYIVAHLLYRVRMCVHLYVYDYSNWCNICICNLVVCVYVCAYVCAHVYMCVHVCTHVCTHVCVWGGGEYVLRACVCACTSAVQRRSQITYSENSSLENWPWKATKWYLGWVIITVLLIR